MSGDNFSGYARYYDLLYADKDYAAETSYIARLLAAHDREIRTVLELGCGTGRHALQLAERGLTVHGIDRAPDMVALAGDRAARSSRDVRARASFAEGDARSVRVGRKFDGVVALFHVVSYLSTERDVDAAFETAAAHLAPGGLFAFDFWYGPAVLTDRPTVRVKRVEDDAIHVTRIAEPVLRQEADIVDVNYQVYVRDKATGSISELSETHPMRYYFQPYLRDKLSRNGFEQVAFRAWMTDQAPSFGSWYAVALARIS